MVERVCMSYPSPMLPQWVKDHGGVFPKIQWPAKDLPIRGSVANADIGVRAVAVITVALTRSQLATPVPCCPPALLAVTRLTK